MAMAATVAEATNYDAITVALRALAARDDDRASIDNGIGFSGADTEEGHRLAARSALTEREAAVAHRMLRRYARQLAEYGIAYAELPAPTEEAAAAIEATIAANRQAREDAKTAAAASKQERRLNRLRRFCVEHGDGCYFICVPYAPAVVEDIKTSIPGRRWDPARRCWTAPLTRDAGTALLALAGRYGLAVIGADGSVVSEGTAGL